jgi:hypothetical protein
MAYYFDDNADADHWRMREFPNDAEALAWAEKLKEKHARGGASGRPSDNDYSCILYADNDDATEGDTFRTVKEWNDHHE